MDGGSIKNQHGVPVGFREACTCATCMSLRYKEQKKIPAGSQMGNLRQAAAFCDSTRPIIVKIGNSYHRVTSVFPDNKFAGTETVFIIEADEKNFYVKD